MSFATIALTIILALRSLLPIQATTAPITDSSPILQASVVSQVHVTPTSRRAVYNVYTTILLTTAVKTLSDGTRRYDYRAKYQCEGVAAVGMYRGPRGELEGPFITVYVIGKDLQASVVLGVDTIRLYHFRFSGFLVGCSDRTISGGCERPNYNLAGWAGFLKMRGLLTDCFGEAFSW